MFHKRYLPFFALALALALAACGGDDGQTGGSDKDTTGGDTAWMDSTQPDTAQPDTATPDTATPDTATPDTTSPDTTTGCTPACGAGFHCEGTTCVADPVGCTPACEAGFHCEDGTCVADPVGCEPACEAGLVCVEGECVAVSNCSGTKTLAELRACTEGALDVTLSGVTVTYVFAQGYFIQDATGAMEVYVGYEWPYEAPAVGDVIDLTISLFTDYENNQEVKGTAAPVKTGTATVTPLDLSSGVLPSEDIEGRLVTITGCTLDDLGGQNGSLSYGSATDVVLRLDDGAGLCPGATFDLVRGLAVQYQDIYRVQVFDAAADLANVSTATCLEFDDSNWGFEEDTQQDPPADFVKGSDAFTANVTSDAAHGGGHSCQLTWTSTSNQDLYQGALTPAAPGQTATFSVWVLDNDPAGRVRPGIAFYDASEVFVDGSTAYSSDYSVDGTDWQNLVFQAPVPDGAAFARAILRMYDVSDAWAGSATVRIDDWSLTVQ